MTFEDLVPRIESLLKEHLIPGAAVGVTDGSQLVWESAFGVKRVGHAEPVTTRTCFGLQSISKNLTAAAVMAALDARLLDLDSPVTTYVPGFSVNSRFGAHPEREMTLRLLLRHRAGFTHEAPVGNNFDAASPSFAAHVASIGETWLRFPVGERYSYSNLGVDLAASVLEAIFQNRFEDQMRYAVLEPMGMADSYVDAPDRPHSTDHAAGHQLGFDRVPVHVPMAGAGGVFAHLKDFACLVRLYLNSGKTSDGSVLLSERALHEMTHASAVVDGKAMGMGLSQRSWRESLLVSTNGSGFGYASTAAWLPEYGYGAVVLMNSASHPTASSQAAELLLDRVIASSRSQGGYEAPGPDRADSAAGASQRPQRFKRDWLPYLGSYRPVFGGGYVLSDELDRSSEIRLFNQDGHLAIRVWASGSPERLIEQQEGLFFGERSGETLDLRTTQPRWASIRIERDTLDDA